MATGSLIFPIGYAPTDGGAVLPGGKLTFSRTGTSTAQNTYSDSTLSTANANPVVLNSEGYLDTKIYGDPSTGFDYRVILKTSADVTIWTVDDVVVDGADTATHQSGSFTATLTGMTGATTGTVEYEIHANSAGTGKICTLRAPNSITGTSNTTALTMTGLPAACTPTEDVEVVCVSVDNNLAVIAQATVVDSATTITFAIDQPFAATGFTNSGVKGIGLGWSITFPL